MLPSSKTSSVRRINSRRPADFLLALALAVLSIGPQPAVADETLGHALSALKEPVPAPDFSLRDMDGTKVALVDYRGKVVLLNFWATWCPPCRREMPSMERLYQSLKDEGFVVIGVNEFEGPDHVFAYIGQLAVDPTYPILFDPDSDVANRYAVRGLPSTYLVDKHGRIRYRAIGGREFDHPDVTSLIRALLAEDVAAEHKGPAAMSAGPS